MALAQRQGSLFRSMSDERLRIVLCYEAFPVLAVRLLHSVGAGPLLGLSILHEPDHRLIADAIKGHIIARLQLLIHLMSHFLLDRVLEVSCEAGLRLRQVHKHSLVIDHAPVSLTSIRQYVGRKIVFQLNRDGFGCAKLKSKVLLNHLYLVWHFMAANFSQVMNIRYEGHLLHENVPFPVNLRSQTCSKKCQNQQ